MFVFVSADAELFLQIWTHFGRYNLRQGDTDVTDIGFRRTVAVTAGILWAAFVCRFWWPSEARRELSKGLGE